MWFIINHEKIIWFFNCDKCAILKYDVKTEKTGSRVCANSTLSVLLPYKPMAILQFVSNYLISII